MVSCSICPCANGQVEVLQARVEHLVEELEGAKAGVAGCKMQLAGLNHSNDGSSSSSRCHSPGRQLSGQGSAVPLMADNTPLPELHAQVLLYKYLSFHTGMIKMLPAQVALQVTCCE